MQRLSSNRPGAGNGGVAPGAPGGSKEAATGRRSRLDRAHPRRSRALQVTGVFEPAGDDWRRRLAEAGVESGGGELVVRREINREGRNRVFVNDQPVTLKLVSDLAPSLLRIHGQREELGLVAPELQRTWLDRSAGAEAVELLERTAAAYAAWEALAERLDRRTGDDRARQERLDLLRFQASEIDAAEVSRGEEEVLRGEREVLRHSEAIQEAMASACVLLFEQENAAWEALGRARHHLEQVSSWEPRAAEWAAELEEIHVRLGDLESDLGRRREEVEADPRRLNAIEDRLAVLERLLRKYGEDTGAVLAHRSRIAAELEELEIFDPTRSPFWLPRSEGFAVTALPSARRFFLRIVPDRIRSMARPSRRFDAGVALGGVPRC